MNQLDETFNVLEDPLIEQLMIHEENKLLIYRRGPLVFAFNFHPTQSFAELRIPVPDPADYRLVLDTDDARFEGFGRVARQMTYPREDVPMEGRRQTVRIYLPNRTAQVLAPVTDGR
jgi:1,4-alpha-glucan branching enzyme